ncbi:MAG: hypothetical protein MUO72_03570 [Bacteroidales bacterium]|nr:hypothetical protein [Bacteroidales bacterium]
MMHEEEKYKKVINILKKSSPVLKDTGIIEENVMARIQQVSDKRVAFNFFDYLFSWVYIGWVRRGLVAASILLVVAFGYQQAMILKRINNLNDRAIFSESQMVTGVSDEIGDKLLLYRLTDGKPYDKSIKISNRQMRRLLESVNELQLKYNDLIRLIEETPDLKKYIDEKMTENNRKKLKL